MTFYVWGGVLEDGTPVNTLYAFDVHTHSWKLLTQNGLVPSPRGYHTCIVLPGAGTAGGVFLFGGEDGRHHVLRSAALEGCTSGCVCGRLEQRCAVKRRPPKRER